MSGVLEIERAIEKLPLEEYRQLRDWIENFDLERDAMAATACVAELLDDSNGNRSQLCGE